MTDISQMFHINRGTKFLAKGAKKVTKKVVRELGVYGDLNDPEYDAELQTKYEQFSDYHNRQLMYYKVREFWATLAFAATAPEFSTSEQIWNSNNLRNRTNYSKNDEELSAETFVGQPSHFFNNEKSPNVTVIYPLPHIYMFLALPENDKAAELWKMAETNIAKTFIPGFKLPISWKKVKEGDTVMPVFPGADRGNHFLKDFVRLGEIYSARSNSGSRPPSVWPSLDDFDELKDYVRLGFLIDTQESYIEPNLAYGDSITAPMGGVNGLSGNMEIVLKCFVEFSYPREYVYTTTRATGKENFLPATFINYETLQSSCHNTGNVRGVYKPDIYISSLHKNQEEYNELIKRDKFTPKKLSSDAGFVILFNGDIVWIPEVNKVKEYTDNLRKAVDPKTGKIIPYASIPELHEKAIWTDWLECKFTYTNESGRLLILDLVGAKPLDYVTAYRLIQGDAGDAGTTFGNIVKQTQGLWNTDPIIATTAKRFLTLDEQRFLKSPEEMYNYARYKFGDLKLFHLAGDESHEIDDYNPHESDAIKKTLKCLYQTIQAAAKYRDRLPLPVRMWNSELGFFLITEILPKYGEIRTQVNANRVANTTKPEIDWNKKIKVANLPGLKSLIPHQFEGLLQKRAGTGSGFVQIDAGGGKTLFSIVDMMLDMMEGKVKRPLVICPTSLVEVWVKEINEASTGPDGTPMLNAFPITLPIWRRWTDQLGMTPVQIGEFIQRHMPPNTIYIVGKSFLSNDRGVNFYAHQKITYSINAYNLTHMGFDRIYDDESHQEKNQNTLRSQALIQLSSYVKGVDLLSGTTIHNNPEDIVGQASIINPAIFGSVKEFRDAFGKDSNKLSGKVVKWDSSIGRKVAHSMSYYVSNIIKRRREWGYLLPDFDEHFFHAKLTPKQQQFYNKLIQELIEDIKRDKKLMEKIESGDPDFFDDIEAQLKRRLMPLEIWINAPSGSGQWTDEEIVEQYKELKKSRKSSDEDEDDDDEEDEKKNTIPRAEFYAYHFRQMASGADLISPKVAVVDALMNLHLKGGTVNTEEGPVTFKPSKNKLAIVGINKAVSAHIFKHIKNKRGVVHYAAGDTEALYAFERDPDVWCIIGDQTSIGTGRNMQMIERMVELQTPWSPGDVEQLKARMFRPDMGNKYSRESVFFETVMTNGTLETAKMARFISRLLVNIAMVEGNNPDFDPIAKLTEKVGLVSMDLDLLQKYSDVGELQDHFDAYKQLSKWEIRQFGVARERLRKKLEEIHKRPVTRAEVPALAMRELEHVGNIPGSRLAYMPFIPKHVPPHVAKIGGIPLDDPKTDKMGLGKGDMVMTEYGPGHITGLYRANVKVTVPGLTKEKTSVTLPRSVVYAIGDKKAHQQLHLTLNAKGNKGMPLLQIGDNGVVVNEVPKSLLKHSDKIAIKEEVPKKLPPKKVVKTDDSSEEEATVNVNVTFINNQLALTAQAEEGQKIDSDLMTSGWTYYGDFYYMQVKHQRGIQNLINQIVALVQKKRVTMKDAYMTSLNKAKDTFTKSKGNMSRVKPANLNEMRNFFINTHKLPSDLKEIRPMIFVQDGIMYIGFSRLTHKKTLPILQGMGRLSGMGKLTKEPGMSVKWFKNKSALVKEIERLQKMGLEIANETELNREVKNLKSS